MKHPKSYTRAIAGRNTLAFANCKETLSHEAFGYARGAAAGLRDGTHWCQPRAVVAQLALAAAAARAAHRHAARALALERNPAAAPSRGRTHTDGKRGDTGAGACQPRSRARQPAGLGRDLP